MNSQYENLTEERNKVKCKERRKNESKAANKIYLRDVSRLMVRDEAMNQQYE